MGAPRRRCELSEFLNDADYGNVIRLPSPPASPFMAGPGHPQWEAMQAFVADRFAHAYGAQVRAGYPQMAGLLGPDGAIVAAAGIRFAEAGPLFLEQYLDMPIETAVGEALGCTASRHEIAEIGSLASIHPAWSMQLFESLPPWLGAAADCRFAVATMRPDLARMLSRSGFGLHLIGDADPARLGQGAEAWGDYYDARPRIYAGRVSSSMALTHLRDRLRHRVMERQARRLARASA